MIVLRLKEIAEKKYYNRHQLSMLTGISYPTIDKYWDGKASSCDFGALDKICALLECEPGDLIKRVSLTVSGSVSPTGDLKITHIPAADKST